MAPLARHTWASLKAEALRRLGGRTEPSFALRVERWLDAAQLDLGLTFHHFELDKTTTALTLALGETTVPLPLDCYIVMGMGLRDATSGAFKRWLTLQRLTYVQANFSQSPAQPAEYARFGSELVLNGPSDQGYGLLLRYYKIPSAPDFLASGSPELSRLWDEHLLEGVLAKAHGALWRPDLAVHGGQLLAEFLAMQVQPSLLQELFPDRPTVPTANRTHGGAQG